MANKFLIKYLEAIPEAREVFQHSSMAGTEISIELVERTRTIEARSREAAIGKLNDEYADAAECLAAMGAGVEGTPLAAYVDKILSIKTLEA